MGKKVQEQGEEQLVTLDHDMKIINFYICLEGFFGKNQNYVGHKLLEIYLLIIINIVITKLLKLTLLMEENMIKWKKYSVRKSIDSNPNSIFAAPSHNLPHLESGNNKSDIITIK